MKQKKKNKSDEGAFTVAHLFSVIGFSLFTLLTYVGLSFIYAGWLAVVCTAIILAVFLGLLIALVKVKGVDSNFKTWRTVEAVLVVVFLALFAVLSKPSVTAVSAVVEGEKLAKAGMDDVKKIRDLMEKYEKQETNAVETTINSLRNASSPASAHKDFLKARGIHHLSETEISAYELRLKEIFLKDASITTTTESNPFVRYYNTVMPKLDRCQKALTHWNVLEASRISTTLIELSHSIPSELTSRSSQAFSDGGPYKFTYAKTLSAADLSKTKRFVYKYELDGISFKKAVKEAYSPVAFIFLAIFLFLMLVVYMAKGRSTVTAVGSTMKAKGVTLVDDGGITIY